jgi:phage antirepressor YoqD-like protein
MLETVVFPSVEKIAADRKAGMTFDQMIASYGLTQHHLTMYMRANNLFGTGRAAEHDDDQIRRDLHAGMMVSEIAAKLGISQSSLSHYMGRNGIRSIDGEGAYTDLDNPVKITHLRKVFDTISGATRVRRVSLPRNSLHIGAIQAGEVGARP